ncbi:uncharacterized protein LOC110699855 [Chenopodium quinoa]|uniref:uncharacterized protein LOC110699855 n=1 Tax=Chenopodium quinoa TaxID=63459 RepID=UPI000B7811F3|nr:uncharacterized protein LOC110699855 [Chenopodium quinoa]
MKEGFTGEQWREKQYTIADGYTWLQGSLQRVNWTQWIWNIFNIPKHAFIVWLAVHNRLRTRDKLLQFCLCDSDLCLLSGVVPESNSHLFFYCNYSQWCLKSLCSWLGFESGHFSIATAWKHWKRRCTDIVEKKTTLATLTTVPYHIWMARNEAYWNGVVIHPRVLCKKVRLEIMDKCHQLISKSWSRAQCFGCGVLFGLQTM